MSDQHGEDIWQRRSLRKIIKEAKRRFRQAEANGDYAGASTSYASVRYSLVRRYLSPAPLWFRPLAVWNMMIAVHHAKRVVNGLIPRTFDQVDVVSRILAKAPKWLGGDKETARALILNVLDYIPVNEPQDEMQPHTRALLLITLGEIEEALGMPGFEIGKHFMSAMYLRKSILNESDTLMAEWQWVRIASACGFWFFDHRDLQHPSDPPGGTSGLFQGFVLMLLPEALRYADKVSADQAEKIRDGCRARGIDPTDFFGSIGRAFQEK